VIVVVVVVEIVVVVEEEGLTRTVPGFRIGPGGGNHIIIYLESVYRPGRTCSFSMTRLYRYIHISIHLSIYLYIYLFIYIYIYINIAPAAFR